MAENKSGKRETGGRESRISDDAIMKMTKEITVKFIEVGRVTPSTFNQTFKEIHQTIFDTVHRDEA